MIDIEKYKNVLEQGLLLDHYSVLCSVRDGTELPKSKRIQGFINLLHKKGYLKEGSLTDSGLILVNTDVVFTSTTTTTTIIENEGEFHQGEVAGDYLQWAAAVHAKMQKLLKEKTGRAQVRGTINGTTYSFLPNVRDFSKVLLKVIVLYKLKDFEKIEKCLIGYIERRSREGKWFPVMGYYIYKNNVSQMITDLEGMEEEDITNDDSSVNI